MARKATSEEGNRLSPHRLRFCVFLVSLLASSNFATAQSAMSQAVLVDVIKQVDLATRSIAKQLEDAKRKSKPLDALASQQGILIATRAYVTTGTPPPPEQLRPVKEAVRWLQRKVWVSCHGLPWLTEEVQLHYGAIVEKNKDALQTVSLATGLVMTYDRLDGGAIQPRNLAGTAIAVGTRRIITNKHVVINTGFGYEDVVTGKLVLYPSPFAKVKFPVEYDRCKPGAQPTEANVEIVGVEYTDPKADFVVLRVSNDIPHHIDFPSDFDVVNGDRLAVIGYPSRPGDNETFLTPVQIDLVFSSPDQRTPFPALRVSEGETMVDEAIEPGYFRYDATTWGGNSGSVVIDLVNGAIIGLHARGLQAKNQGSGYNEGVRAPVISAALKTLN